MERVILQWNLQNWITVFLMVSLGYAIVSTVAMVATAKFSPVITVSNG